MEAMNDKQLRLRGVGDGNHFVAYTGAVDWCPCTGHAGGQWVLIKGGDKTALTWNADGDNVAQKRTCSKLKTW